MTSITIAKEYMTDEESATENVLTKTSLLLRHVARVCFLATFIEDGYRKIFLWSLHVYVIGELWGCGGFVAGAIVLSILMTELGGSVVVLLQRKVHYACAALAYSVLVQTGLRSSMWNWNLRLTLNDLATTGGVFLLLAEINVRPTFLDHGVLVGKKPKNYFQLTGRCLLMFMFVTILRLDLTFPYVLQDVLESVLMVLVMIGYKTRLSAVVLMTILAAFNVYENAWWAMVEEQNRELVKFVFFRGLSVIGGLLMLALQGPGGISLDERKKLL